MKVIRPVSLAKRFFAGFCLILAPACGGLAQISSVPVVTIQATRPVATLTSSGEFTVFRAGGTNATLNVWYEIGGTASNGVDYAAIPLHLVEIPAGATSNTIVIKPLTNPPPASAARTVVLTLTNSPLMTPVNYEIGSPSQAVVFIEPTNSPPLPQVKVSIFSPSNGAVFYMPTNLSIFAAASPSTLNLEFYAGTNDLGRGIPYLSGGIIVTYFYLTWTNPPPGEYALTAVVPGNGSTSITSAPVNVTILLPPTNPPPVVSIGYPADGAVFNAPANIPFIAKAYDPGGNVTNVEFFANGADLGPCLPVVLDPPGMGGVTGLVYYFNWQNVPTNIYSLTAVAADNGGASTTSAPVKITVQLPPTNLPPVVRIISPPNGAVFFAPVNIPLYAYARAFVWQSNVLFDQVSNLEFYADGADLGPGQHVVYGPPPPPPGGVTPLYVTLLPDNFFLVWSNAPIGQHGLTAVAEDYFGNSVTSAPVNIKVAASPPPPTNRPAIVSIVATDPIAIEGTNCWTWPGLAGPTATWSNWLAPTATFCWFTNCGPKNATFSVFRFGDTNGVLMVAYGIGGSATNGIDYVTLPGTVTIPAGKRRADITVVPLDDGPPDITSSVVLKLAPDATGTNYLLGYPRVAAAIILDSQSPRAATGIIPGGGFNLAAAGPDGAWFHVEASTDLVHWTPICTNQVVNGSIDFVDPDAAANPLRYYRTVPEAGPPQ
jgi:hypothetical protein